jgi:uncharacterized membrane protein YgcG
MTRRTLQALLLLTALSAPALARAQTDFVGPVVARIEAEGFTVSDVKRTLLGRVLIVSTNRDTLREVVLNRQNGEILRDRAFALPTAQATAAGDPATGVSPAGGSGVSSGSGGSNGAGGQSGGTGAGGGTGNGNN